MYLANLVWEILPQKLGVGRFRLEAATAAVGLALLAWGGTPWRRWRFSAGFCSRWKPSITDGRSDWWSMPFRPIAAGGEGVSPAVGPPSPQPARGEGARAVLSGAVRSSELAGRGSAILERLPAYRLGVRWVGVPFDLELATIPGADPAPVRVGCGRRGMAGRRGSEQELALDPGGVGRAKWTLCPRERQGGGMLEIVAEDGGRARRIRIEHEGCLRVAEAPPVRGVISRYPGGRRSAFVWRGDMDLYDVPPLPVDRRAGNGAGPVGPIRVSADDVPVHAAVARRSCRARVGGARGRG